MKIQGMLIVAVMSFVGASALAECLPQAPTREDLRRCSENQPDAKPVKFNCSLLSGKEILKTVTVVNYDKKLAKIQALLENVALDQNTPALKEDINNSGSIMGGWVQSVDDAKCVVAK